MGTLLVAAGGGGDAIAAAALAGLAPEVPVGIATMAWDRLIVDPLPGPRAATDFTELENRAGWRQVTSRSKPVAPAGSTLPRLAAEQPLPIVLLDPTRGARGMRHDLEAAAVELGAQDIRLVDVGGDLLGQPGDTGLRSPFADALTAASCLGLSAMVWIAGPGLDGELSEELVLQRARAATAHKLRPQMWQPYLPILRWHPSEATALLAAATLGTRGTVEIRDAGLPVRLTEHSATVLELDMPALCAVNPLINSLAGTESLAEAEESAVRILGRTELDSERAKAIQLERVPRVPDDLVTAVPPWEADLEARGVDYVTYRRMAERFGYTDVHRFRTLIAERCPRRGTGLLWAVDARPE
ncbi:DUF1152 domain-containing protein [Actinoplanes sp. NPDC024001]|uniref:DUF1152 domain-containing protein n=1 Tax=Actinoplanes sp. NPDC024001 TaxID=3154598 RepID=UPI0033D6B1D1